MEGPTSGDSFCEEQTVNTTPPFVSLHVVVLLSQQSVTIRKYFLRGENCMTDPDVQKTKRTFKNLETCLLPNE